MATPTYVFRTSDLPKLDLDTDRGTDFQAWHHQWLAYRSLSGLAEQPATKQVQALQLCFSRETLNVVENLGLTAEAKQDQAEIITALKLHVEGLVNETVERRNFRRRIQHERESFDDFLVALRELAKTCNFCNNECLQKALRDQIIEGLQDGEIIQELLQARDLTLDQTVAKCRGLEAAKRSRKDIEGSLEVNAIHSRTPHATAGGTGICAGCGKAFHQGGRIKCPAFNQSCHKCGKIGHFSSVCRRKQPSAQTQQGVTPRANALSSGLPLVQLSELKKEGIAPAPTIKMQITSRHGEACIDVLPDSGADICAAGPHFVEALGEHMDNLAPSNITPRAVNGTILQPLGMIPDIKFTFHGRSTTDNVHIYDSVSGTLIAWRTAKALSILPESYPNPMTAIQACHSPRPPIPTAGQIMSEFPTVFDGKIQLMPGEKFHISLTDDARPFCVTTPRSIPFAYRDKLKPEIDLLVDQGIITPVTEPTEWCAPIVVTPKKDSDRIRMCVDLSKLNKFVRRERYPSIPPAEAVADIQESKAKYFSMFDALKGYHQCPLDEDSQKLTTFITPFGRFMFCRAPYGICSISEHYNRRMDEAFEGMRDFRKVVDDVLAFDSDPHDHVEHVRQLLRRCQEKGISLNREKFKFCQSEIHFAGFRLTPEGYSISAEITNAIANFPSPSSRTDLRSFCGLVNQLASSTNEITAAIAPLRPLLSSRNEFLWSTVHENAFKQSKRLLTSAPILAFFDARKETRLYTDASSIGLGFVLLQKSAETDADWKVVQAGSRFLSDVESRYAVVELECLAVVWSVQKCHLFLAGLSHFTIITDHSPLIPILNTHRLDEIENPRLQRLRTRIMSFKFTAQWLKGSKNVAADALSRHPHNLPVADDNLAEFEVDVFGDTSSDTCLAPSITQIRNASLLPPDQDNLRVQEVREHAEKDEVYQNLKKVISNGFPIQRGQLSDSLKAFWGVRDSLTLDDELIVYGCRLFIPASLRPTMLNRLHEAHQGVSRSKARARLTLYWPGMDEDIENFVAGCRHCQDRLPSNPKEPMLTKPVPSRPFQHIAADFAAYGGKQFLIVVDCKTDWPDIVEMGHDTTAKKLTEALRNQFCRTAAPDVLWSDGGPQFTSKHTADFLKSWSVSHSISSPHYPQSNGKAEATVKSMKKLISAAWTGRSVNWNQLSRSLLQYRNTPCRKDGLSPAQKLFGHPVQDTLPAHRRAFKPEWQKSVTDAEDTSSAQRKMELTYNQHAHDLSELRIGNHVALQNPVSRLWDVYGVVTAVGPRRRYFVKTRNGNVLVRNRRFLRKRAPISVASPAPHGLQLPCSDSASTTPTPPASTSVHPPSSTSSNLRRSTRSKRRPDYLLEDTSWLSSSSVSSTQELGGEV